MTQASRDENRIPTLLGVSSADGTTPVTLFADPTTHRLYVDLAAGGTTTVDAGTITTLAPGASATVVNSGTTTDAVFDFGIPAGEKGDPGDPGATGPVGMVWKDAYVGATAYVVNDAVSYNGSSYICILNSTGNLPTDTTYWSLVAQKGSDGLGTGDMLASVYDPTNVADDAFDMDNMAQGTTNKFLSSAELTVVQNTSGANTGDQEATDFDIKDLTDSTNLRTTWNGKVDKSLFDANTILYATTDDTPVALTIPEQTIVGRKTGGNIEALAIDSDLSSVSANDDTVPSAKITKAYADSKVEDSIVDGHTTVAPSGNAVSDALALKAPLASPTFTGTITLADNARIDLTLPTADTYVTGNTTDSFSSGYSSAVGDLVFFGSGGKWLEVDADAVATCKGMMGIALESKTDGQAMLVALPGSFVRLDSWNWTVGDTLYAGETLGGIQNTIPTGADAIIRVIGFAVSADVIYFMPSSDQQSTVA